MPRKPPCLGGGSRDDHLVSSVLAAWDPADGPSPDRPWIELWPQFSEQQRRVCSAACPPPATLPPAVCQRLRRRQQRRAAAAAAGPPRGAIPDARRGATPPRAKRERRDGGAAPAPAPAAAAQAPPPEPRPLPPQPPSPEAPLAWDAFWAQFFEENPDPEHFKAEADARGSALVGERMVRLVWRHAVDGSWAHLFVRHLSAFGPLEGYRVAAGDEHHAHFMKEKHAAAAALRIAQVGGLQVEDHGENVTARTREIRRCVPPVVEASGLWLGPHLNHLSPPHEFGLANLCEVFGPCLVEAAGEGSALIRFQSARDARGCLFALMRPLLWNFQQLLCFAGPAGEAMRKCCVFPSPPQPPRPGEDEDRDGGQSDHVTIV